MRLGNLSSEADHVRVPVMSMRSSVLLALLVLGMGSGEIATEAHHSFAAEYDASKPVVLTGTVTKMLWVNPHAWLFIDVRTADGPARNWAIELRNPVALYRLGWRQRDLRPGVVVTVEGWRAKGGQLAANATRVDLPDGRRLLAGSPEVPERQERRPRSARGSSLGTESPQIRRADEGK